ncbi:hypothetical protein SSPO_001530 [Streptomyces antimycoticus]|uniref:Uncharacterized protein n=1 Tax=Streptomyces antimycoticus TaxID=68175 RepID=A0A499UA36_9ACTN|nr:hypothetical protein SSPO_001530 [Streptomyces antimycoticus]
MQQGRYVGAPHAEKDVLLFQGHGLARAALPQHHDDRQISQLVQPHQAIGIRHAVKWIRSVTALGCQGP